MYKDPFEVLQGGALAAMGKRPVAAKAPLTEYIDKFSSQTPPK